MSKNQKQNLLITALILIIVLLIGLLVYKIVEKDNNLVEESNNKIEETELTEESSIYILESDVNAISHTPDGSPIITDLYKKTNTINDLSEEQKMIITLHIIPIQNKSENYSNEIPKQVFEETYHTLFGNSVITHKDINSCPIATYDKTKEIYTLSQACGGGSPYEYLKYNYKYTKENNKYYVYQSIGIINGELSKIEKDVNGTIYKDYEEGFQITKDNYQDFSSYKWTFEKENNNYIFKQVERIK